MLRISVACERNIMNSIVDYVKIDDSPSVVSDNSRADIGYPH